MAGFLFDYGLYLVFLYIIIEYFDTLLTRKIVKKFFFFISWLCYFALQLVVSPKIDCPIISILYNIISVFIVCHLTYQGTIKIKFLLSFALISTWTIIELLTGYILLLFDINKDGMLELGSVISKIILFGILKILEGRLHFISMKDINLQYWFSLIALPVCSIFVVYNLYVLDYKRTKSFYSFSTVSIFLILILNILFYKLYDRLSKDAEIQKQNCIYEKQIELCMTQIQEREQMDLEVRELKHNIKSHLICIGECIKMGDDQKLNTYLSDLYSSLNSEKRICETGNIIIDTMINFKYRECQNEKIQFDCEVVIPSNSIFNNVDLSVILGNAFDNAIDAATKLNTDRRYIYIKMMYRHGNLLIIVGNSFNGFSKRGVDGRYLTIKNDTKNYGMGLHSIERAASKYNGLVCPESFDHEFKLTILLYGT